MLGTYIACRSPERMSRASCTASLQIALQPTPAGARLVEESQARGFGVQLADHLVDVALAGADRSQGDRLGARLLRGAGDGDGLLAHVQTDIQHVKCIQDMLVCLGGAVT